MTAMTPARLVCLDMDRVLVDHLSTWQFVYDRLGISNDESFELYNQGPVSYTHLTLPTKRIV